MIRRRIDQDARARLRRSRNLQGMSGLPGNCYDAADGDPELALILALRVLEQTKAAG